jgi:putative Holliday junction resolvase
VTPSPALGRLLAIDLGDRRIGLAISDPTGTIASPAGFIERRAGKRPPLTALLAKATELGATGFVVGLPLDSSGEDTPRAGEARRLAHELSTRTGLGARLHDIGCTAGDQANGGFDAGSQRRRRFDGGHPAPPARAAARREL